VIALKAQIKVLPDQKCLVLNYRCKPAVWETGTVTDVEISVGKDRTTRPTYTVILDRKSISKREKYRAMANNAEPWGTVIRLYVGNKAIEPLKNKR